MNHFVLLFTFVDDFFNVDDVISDGFIKYFIYNQIKKMLEKDIYFTGKLLCALKYYIL